MPALPSSLMTAIGLVVATGGCAGPATKPAPPDASAAPRATATTSGATAMSTAASTHADDKGLEVWFEISPDVVVERIPMRKAVLHFANRSEQPIRIYLPQSEPFRANISTLHFTAGDARFAAPDPHPHGYVVTEIDFPLLAPGAEKTWEQPFSLDPMGAGTGPTRRPGFESGAEVRVRWIYENEVTRWAGGLQTLDGPTKGLFDGKDIPYIWTGKLSVEARWVAP
ncbi:MAG: hypothetical protein HY908_34930 [Myxococcales bacterium]|nr:hypothetical protein [Myxococcales bacterium]